MNGRRVSTLPSGITMKHSRKPKRMTLDRLAASMQRELLGVGKKFDAIGGNGGIGHAATRGTGIYGASFIAFRGSV
jgi:hypothetical protein